VFVPRYPEDKRECVYRCTDCGYRIPDFQGTFWFVRERERGDSTIEVPYCPECKAESITLERV
jgi:NAD-dependent SIR2 family protein deacetylase